MAAVAVAITCSLQILGAENTADTGPHCELAVRGQSLDGALQEVARQCGVQILYFSNVTAGMNAERLSGRYAVDEALRVLLADTGLGFRHINAKTIEIHRPPADEPASAVHRPAQPAHTESEAELEELVIRGTALGLVATRIETPLRDLPQSISVVSKEQMRLQSNFDLDDALDDVVGLTSARVDSLFQFTYSRGFQVSSYTLDGGGALHSFSQSLVGPMIQAPDLSEFDHVEVLRGANALFGADSPPGGAINLVRKRPQPDGRLVVISSGGSWNNFRQELDVTGPLALDGALRGRLDVSYGEHDYFYDHAHERSKSIFGVVDYDLAPGTLLTLGGSHSNRSAQPKISGLPRFNTGADPHLPLSTAYIFDWSRYESRTREGYLQLAQEFGANWNLRVHATSLDQRIDYLLGTFFRPITATTGGIPLRPVARYSIEPSEQRQFNLEATLTGRGHWADHAVEMAFGVDFLHADSHSLSGQILFGTPLANAWQFDPSVYPNPVTDPLDGRDVGQKLDEKLVGLFASMKVQATERWSLTAGLRASDNEVADHGIYYFGDFEFPLDFDYEYERKVTPFFGTMFTIDANLSLYASYADIYFSNLGLERPDGSLLSPSDGVNMEVGIKSAWRDGAINASLAVFKIDDQGIAALDPGVEPTTAECCYTAHGRSISKGIDLELTGYPVPEWVIGAGYTFNESKRAHSGDQIVNPVSTQTPRHLFKMWTNYALPAGWSVGGSVQAQSATHNDSRGCPVLTASGFCLSGFQNFRAAQGSYVLVNPRVGYQFNEHWQVALNVNNVFDRRYYDTLGTTNGGNWYGEPRNFMLRLDARF